jgi:hypothetical protein
MYQKKGFEGETLDKIVEVITANPDVWVSDMMSEEFQMSPPEKTRALGSALIVGLSALIGSLIPMSPFFFLNVDLSIWLSILVAALTLFAPGYKARITVGSPEQRTANGSIGTVSALQPRRRVNLQGLHPYDGSTSERLMSTAHRLSDHKPKTHFSKSTTDNTDKHGSTMSVQSANVPV